MARRKAEEGERRRRQPATSPEQRELELSSLAYDLAEEQIQSGSASSQVITHFLKAGSSRERLEQQKIEYENQLLAVKREAIEAQARVEAQYKEALDAMRSYSGQAPVEEEDPDVA